MQRTIENNLKRYPWFQFATSLLAWLPIFFLYFSQFVTLQEAVQLGAIYYFVVCLWEVPSGYFSDRIGRRTTLLVSSIGNVVAYLFFLFANDFNALAAGQFFLALSIALLSGTDTAFLYDSLIALNQKANYLAHEAKAQKYSFIGLAFACIAGGILGLIDLRLAYLLSLGGALWTAYLAFTFVEPLSKNKAYTSSFTKDLIKCLSYLSNKTLAWLFGTMTLMYCLEHIAYEFYQPYIKLLDIQWISGDRSPLISAIIIALSMFGGSIGAAYSLRLTTFFGIKTLLFLAMLFQLGIVASLAFSLSSVLICSVIFRNFPMAVIRAPMRATIAPLVSSELRATYLSIQSLSARLVFSSALLYLSRTVTDSGNLDWVNLTAILKEALLFGIIGLLIAALFSRRVLETS